MMRTMTLCRTVAVLVIGLHAVLVAATQCHVGVVHGRTADQGAEALDCPPELYGSDAVCGYSCVRDTNTMSDVCSFLCLPQRQCRETFIHPESPASPGLLHPDCPKHENYQPVQASYLECVARCCQGDMCNTNSAWGSHCQNMIFPLLLAVVVMCFILNDW